MTAGPLHCPDCGKTHPRGCTGHRSTTGGPCGNWPIPGGSVCRYHGGRARQVADAATRRLEAELVVGELARLGVRIPVVDGAAIVAMRDEAAGNVTVLRQMVQRLDLDPDGDGPAVYGATFHVSGRLTGEAKANVVWVMYCEERDRLAKLDEACVRLGLREREVRVHEATLGLIAAAVDAMLDQVIPRPLHARAREVLMVELERSDRRA